MISISNDRIWVEINSLGAELENIFIDGKNILWHKSEIWNGQSPILFPICGRLENNYFLYDGVKYELKRHGFARNREFELVKKTENEAIFRLLYDDETLKSFPFLFELFIKYFIVDNNLIIEISIVNLGDKDLYASCGTHPGLDMNGLKDFLGDNIFVYLNKTIANEIQFDNVGCVNKIELTNLKNNTLNDFISEIIDKQTLCYEGVQKVELIGSDGKIAVMTDSKYMAFWCDSNENFICIEGWDGIPDLINTNAKIEDKVGINKIASKETHKITFSLKFEN